MDNNHNEFDVINWMSNVNENRQSMPHIQIRIFAYQ